MSDMKPTAVTLKGRTVQNPEQPMVKTSDELDEAALDQVSGGIIIIGGRSFENAVEQVRLPAGVGSFHPGAWAT